jgi:hypothetical protein
MPLHVLSHEGTRRNDTQLRLLRLPQYSAHEFRTDPFSAQCVRNLSMNQLDEISRFAVKHKCSFAVLFQFISMESRIIDYLFARHPTILLGRRIALQKIYLNTERLLADRKGL